MFSAITFICTLFFGCLFMEMVLIMKLHKKLKNSRAYIYNYLVTNSKDETLERYVLRSFFPKYLIFLLCFFSLSTISYFHPYATAKVVESIVFISLLAARIYNRKIFSSIWNVL